MVSWTSDGGISGYDAATGAPTDSKYKLSSNGTVNTQGITRLQYNLPQPNYSDKIRAIVPLTYVAGDIPSGKKVTATMFVAPASAFAAGVVPTPSQILALGATLLAYRSKISATAAGSNSFDIDGPRASKLEPNTKYWVLVVPTAVADMSYPANYVNDQPVGSANTTGRAISVWTNRTPKAPTITSPATNTVTASGTALTLSYTSADDDLVTGSTSYTYTDLAGVQVQYAARPTPDNPNPTWTDLPIYKTDGSGPGPGWYLDSAVQPASGSLALWNNRTITLRCGSLTPGNGEAALPSGDWQIRLRTFDYGHPYPVALNPANKADAALDVATFPATNTSPWSTAVNVSVTAQVPPPTPLSPANDIAIVNGIDVTLSWLYRNTYSPPFAQASRTVQIRKVGDTAWTTLVSGNSASAAYTITAGSYAFAVGNEYEWRVQVTDAGSVTSVYSVPARFWIVAAPASGAVRPLPVSTLDGATLGCGRHRVFVYRRGGKTRVGEITQMSSVEWNRQRDDISLAEVKVTGWGIDCGNLLAQLQTWAYELVIFRDNGYSVDRVWEGPITLLTYEVDSVTIQAKDVMAYAYRRIIKQKMSDSANGDTVTSRAARVLQNAFAPDDPNVLAYLQVLSRNDDAMQYRTTPAYSRTAFEEVDDMAANAGLDYTAVGRAILLWGTKHRIGTLPEFRDSDLGAPPIVSEYGMSMANRYVVSDGNGVYGEANRLNVSGNDPTYGLIEMLSSTWASDSPSDTGTYTQAGLATVQKSFADYAERSIADRYPPPVVVRVPDNTSLNPSTVISIQQLVPGVVIPLRSTGTLRTVRDNQKLDSVKVVEVNDSETVSVTMSPFNGDDAVTAGA